MMFLHKSITMTKTQRNTQMENTQETKDYRMLFYKWDLCVMHNLQWSEIS